MALIPLVLIVVLLWFYIKCYRKESEISGMLKAINLCTRLYTFITMSLLLAGPVSLIGGIVVLALGEGTFLQALPMFAVSIALFLLGLKMFKAIHARCPEPLRKRLFGLMFMAAFGMGIKICLFFLPFVWALSPKMVHGADGKEYILDGLDVYDKNGNWIGKYDPSTGEITILKQY